MEVLSNGLYFVRIKTGQERQVEKLKVLKEKFCNLTTIHNQTESGYGICDSNYESFFNT